MLTTRRVKRFIIISLVILVGLIFYNKWALQKTDESLLKEKYDSIHISINTLADAVDHNAMTGGRRNGEFIINSVESLDKLYQVYAEAYRRDEAGLKLISHRYYETSIFEPFTFPAFVEELALGKQQGDITIGYTPVGQSYRELHIYYRWIPSFDLEMEEQYLVIAGVSKYSVVTKIPFYMSGGLWVMSFIFLVFIMINMVMLVLLGDIWGNRKGGKYRKCSTPTTSGTSSSEQSSV